MKVTAEVVASMIHAAAKGAATAAADQLHAYAVALTPLGETGELRSTSAVVPDATKPAAEVVYAKIYAARQHEETSWNHPRAGQAKFLEQAAQDNTSFLRDVVASHMKGILA